MSGNFDGIKKQKYGVEVECTGKTKVGRGKTFLGKRNKNHGKDDTRTSRSKDSAMDG